MVQNLPLFFAPQFGQNQSPEEDAAGFFAPQFVQNVLPSES